MVELRDFQALMEETYGARDRARGTAASVAWLVEEVGELAQAIRKGDDAARRYADGCPRCGAAPCTCPVGA